MTKKTLGDAVTMQQSFTTKDIQSGESLTLLRIFSTFATNATLENILA
jgi:hypothetical protein